MGGPVVTRQAQPLGALFGILTGILMPAERPLRGLMIAFKCLHLIVKCKQIGPFGALFVHFNISCWDFNACIFVVKMQAKLAYLHANKAPAGPLKGHCL